MICKIDFLWMTKLTVHRKLYYSENSTITQIPKWFKLVYFPITI